MSDKEREAFDWSKLSDDELALRFDLSAAWLLRGEHFDGPHIGVGAYLEVATRLRARLAPQAEPRRRCKEGRRQSRLGRAHGRCALRRHEGIEMSRPLCHELDVSSHPACDCPCCRPKAPPAADVQGMTDCGEAGHPDACGNAGCIATGFTDAERYAWIRETFNSEIGDSAAANRAWDVIELGAINANTPTELDGAIDAALRAQSKGEKE